MSDGVHGTRNDAEMQRMRGDPAAKVVPVLDGKNLVADSQRPISVLLPFHAAEEHLIPDTIVFLGLDTDRAPVFGAACSTESTDHVTALANAHGSAVRLNIHTSQA